MPVDDGVRRWRTPTAGIASLRVLLSSMLVLVAAADAQETVVTAEVLEHLELLNQLRKEGFKCPTKARTQRVACESPNHRTFRGCTMAMAGKCHGRVRLGFGTKWTPWKEVDGNFPCSNAWFGQDPFQGQAKECTCESQGEVFAPNAVPLKLHCDLWKAATLHTEDMSTQDYFSHISKDGRSPWVRAAEQGTRASAENIAAWYSTSAAILDILKKSEWHCRNMMNASFEAIGIGHAYNAQSEYGHYWTQMFSSVASVNTSCYPATAVPADDFVSARAWEHFELVNQLRFEGFTCPGGMTFAPNPEPLKFDCRLWKASRGHSKDMALQGYFSHLSKDGRKPWDRASAFGADARSENIIAGRGTASAALEVLKNSTGHCKNMMNGDFKVMAVGYASNPHSQYGNYWTQMFSRDDSVEDISCKPPGRRLLQNPATRRLDSVPDTAGAYIIADPWSKPLV